MRCAHGQQVYGKLWRWSFTLRIMSSRNRLGDRYTSEWACRFTRRRGCVEWRLLGAHRQRHPFFERVSGFHMAQLYLQVPEMSSDHFLPLNKEVYRNFIFLQHTWASLSRGGDGFLFGCLAGHYSRGLSNWSYGRFDPIVEFMRPVPSLTLIPLMIIWFGIGKTSKIITLFLVALLIMVAAKF